MSRGSFEAGLEALGAFESGKPSGDPEQYRVQNTLGFTGKYQFGEALLIDLGYYQADTFYGNGAATNLWQGTWTAKAQAFGVNSIEDFRNSPEIQEAAIRNAFEFNWNIIETTLGNAGKNVDDFIGNTITFNDGGTEKSVTITPFGILAGAHLRGPYGLANLLLNGSVSYDEYGTSILRYVDEYAGYDVPVQITGGAVVNPPIEPPVNPTEPVDPVAPDPVIPNSGESLVGTDGVQDIFSFTWNWGNESLISNFNPSEDTIDLKNFWTDYNNFTIVEDGNNTIIDLSAINNQKIILQGVSASQLSSDNITGVAGEFPLTNNPGGDPTTPTTPPLPKLSIDDVSILEGDVGNSSATFTVQLSAPSATTVTVNYGIADNTAIAGSDYIATNNILTFNPGETSQTISVTVKGDTEIEARESFYVQLSNSVNADLLDSQGVGTIINDDRAPNTGDNSQPIVGAYYPEWAIYDRDYQVTDIPADKLTHVFYAFAKIDDQGKVSVFDSYAATDKRFDGDWNTPKEFAGNFEQLLNLKEQNPNLKTLISIGGWTLSDKFSDVALTDASRETFAKSAVEFMTKYGFDGIDIDWEYPVSGGLAGNTYRPEDKHNYTLLVQELDEQLQIQEAKDNQDYLLTIASPAGFDKIQNYELGAMSQHLDFFNVMAYDYHGAWENTTNHNAPLYANPLDPSSVSSQYNIDSTIQTYLSEGVPADKIVLGAPAYGRTWTGVGSDSNGLFQSATGAGAGTWENGIIDYNDLYNKLQTDSNYVRYWDDAAKVPYVYNAQTGFFSTYEDTESLGLKLDYIKNNQLRGIFFWEASGDIHNSNDPNSLINLAATELGVKSDPTVIVK